jgi:hypothetical protein
MTLVHRREYLKLCLGGLLQTAGTVVLATAVLPARAADATVGSEDAKDLQERADQVADAQGPNPAEEGSKPSEWVNGAFRNAGGGGGGFRNGGFANGGGGGGFRNGGFVNGGWRNL